MDDPRVAADLARSGLVAQDMRITTIEGSGFTPDLGYRIPYFLPDGTPHPQMYRVRLFEEQANGQKYTQPSGIAPFPYFPPAADWKSLSKQKICYIIEGEKKAAAAVKHLGLLAIGIGGCFNWAGPKTARVHRSLNPAIAAALPAKCKVEIVFDGDFRSNDQVGQGLAELCIALRDRGHEPVVVELPEAEERLGLDDWLVLGNGIVAFRRLPRSDGRRLWEGRESLAHRAKLRVRRNADGFITKIEPNSDNALRILKTREEYRGRLMHNALDCFVYLDGDRVEDSHISSIAGGLQHYVDPTFRAPVVGEALSQLCFDPAYSRNPLKEYLYGLKWDGVSRVPTLFANYFNSPMEVAYTTAVSVNWMKMLIARAENPGCKADNMLILEGDQGIGKSRALRVLGGEYYRESKVHDVGSKDFLINLRGAWIYDINELRALRRTDQATIKALLSSQEDTFRAPYARGDSTFKRTAVIVGTTNEWQYLSDETGARRFWPVRCGYHVEVDMLAADRDQLLAEAIHLYHTDPAWWIMPDEIHRMITGARAVISPLHDAVQSAVEDFASLDRHLVKTVDGLAAEVWAHITLPQLFARMGFDNIHLTGEKVRQAVAALRVLGFEKVWLSNKRLGLTEETEKGRHVYRVRLGNPEQFSLTPSARKSKLT